MNFPEIPQLPVPLQYQQVTFTGLEAGPKLIVLGAVHGNEINGSRCILKFIEEFQHGQRLLNKGQVTFVPFTNPLAVNRQQRNGDRNLNRNLSPSVSSTDSKLDFEDHIAQWLCPLLASHDVLLDIHSFAQGDRPFALFGPDNNSGNLEPFSKSEFERGLAFSIGVDRFVEGWLKTYEKGVRNRIQYAQANGLSTQNLNLDSKYGVGTTEYMRSKGGVAVTLECGQHQDPGGLVVAYNAVDRTLKYLQLIDGATPNKVIGYEHLRLTEVIDKHHSNDQFTKQWSSFDHVTVNTEIGKRTNGESVVAPYDAFVVFPNSNSAAGQEWFYLAQQVNK